MRIRQIHRWTSITFVAIVIATFVVLMLDPESPFAYVPLAPLLLLMVTGMTMFFQPYLAKRRSGRQPGSGVS